MKILLLTQFCTPEPVFKSVPFAKELRSRGHDARILTGVPNYPGGRLYYGYKLRLWQRDLIDGVPILRVPLYPSHDKSAIGRILNYSSFAVSSVVPVVCGWKPDITWVNSLPHNGIVARLGATLRSIPYVMDIQDLWPDAVGNSGMIPRPLLWPFKRLATAAYMGAARVACLSPGMKRVLASRGLSEDRLEVIYNWCDEDSLKSSLVEQFSPDDLGLSDRFNIMFAGTMGRAQGLSAVIEAAKHVYPKNPRIQFVFMGAGRLVEDLKRLAATVAPHNTKFLPRCPMHQVAQFIRMADVMLVHLRRHPLYEITIPSKIQAYMAMGKPILAALAGDAAELIIRAGAGKATLPEDPSAIAEGAVQLATMPRAALHGMGEAAKAYYEQNLSMRVGVSHFERLFQAAVQF